MDQKIKATVQNEAQYFFKRLRDTGNTMRKSKINVCEISEDRREKMGRRQWLTIFQNVQEFLNSNNSQGK